MKAVNAIIIDDEKHARQSLAGLLELYCPEVRILGEADNVSDAKAIIEALSPTIVFLDINIGEESGFNLLKQLDQVNFQLIFTTAHSEFAIRAFRVNALDYLLKPIEPDLLQAAVEKVREARGSSVIQGQLNHLVESLRTQSLRRLAIPSSDGITFLEIVNIIHIGGSGNYSTFHLDNGEKVTASKNLGHFESLLGDEQFFRCHQSHIVNLDYMKRIITKDGNSIELKNGLQAPIALKRKEALMAAIDRRMRS
jgi:two-component system, LytTR family, response regulator